MATWGDVRRIALALPEAREHGSSGSHAEWRVRDKLFAWERPLRRADLLALGRRAPKGAILAARVPHLVAKEALLASSPAVFFTTPHFDGYPAVLTRLARIKRFELKELLVEAWASRAPKRLVKEYVHPRFKRRS